MTDKIEIKVDQGIVVLDMGMFTARMTGADAQVLGNALFKRGCEADGYVPDVRGGDHLPATE